MSLAADLIAEGVRAERAGALDRALEAYQSAAAQADNPETQARALTHQADVHRSRCQWEASLEAVGRAQDVARAANLTELLAEAVIAEVNLLISRGDPGAAIEKCERIAESSSDSRLRGIALQNLGTIRAQHGQAPAAERAFRESLGNFQKAGYRRGEAIALNNLGRLAIDTSDATGALPLLQRALALGREVEDSELIAITSLNIAWALCASGGNVDRAQDLAMAALGHFSACDNHWREIECLRLIGEINERCLDAANAERCYECALRLAEEIKSDVEVRLTRERLARLRGSHPAARRVT